MLSVSNYVVSGIHFGRSTAGSVPSGSAFSDAANLRRMGNVLRKKDMMRKGIRGKCLEKVNARKEMRGTGLGYEGNTNRPSMRNIGPSSNRTRDRRAT